MRCAIPRSESPDSPGDAEKILEQRLEAALDDLDDNIVTDGGVGVGFLDEAWPRPTDNNRLLWVFEKPMLSKETPIPSFDDVVFGFCALNSDSVVACKDDLSTESVGDFSHSIRQQNPDRPIIIVFDDFSSHFTDYIDLVVERSDLTRVALPRHSPDLNQIEQIWRYLKRDLSPRDAADLDTYCSLIADIFHRYAKQSSFAQSWIDRSLNIQKL